MKSVYNFVVTPVGERYNNSKKVEGGDLILNTEIYNHQFVNRINRTQMEIGQLESRKHQALHFMAGTNDELSLLQNELREKYGTDNINIQDGTIIYPQNEQTDKKD